MILILIMAILILDFLYYDQLLLGAADSLLRFEDQIKSKEQIDIVPSASVMVNP